MLVCASAVAIDATDAIEACYAVDVGDVLIQIITAVDGRRGQKVEATRFLAGGRLVVGGWQGPPMVDVWPPDDVTPGWWLPPLAQAPSVELLSDLAADPAMLPG